MTSANGNRLLVHLAALEVTFSMSISLALAGWASSKWGPIPTIRFLAVVQLSWGALFLFLTRELRAESAGLEHEDVQAPEPQPVG